MSVPSTRDRVPDHTSDAVNIEIERTIEANVRQYAANDESIGRRLAALDAEWDIERAIEANASSLAFVGVALGYFIHPYWLILPAAVTAFLFQHAIQGWCPPIPVLRRLGFRTVNEIEKERQALKAIRGDYEGLRGQRDRVATDVMSAINRR